MYNFFVDENKRQGEFYLITDDDYNHIKNVLRLEVGTQIEVCIKDDSTNYILYQICKCVKSI